MKKTILAAIQMASSPSVSGNLVEAGRLIQAAAAKGAKLIALPENFALMGLHENDKLEVAEAEGEGPIQEFLSKTAKAEKVWLIGGTIPIKAASGKVRAASLVYNDKGERVEAYFHPVTLAPVPTQARSPKK